jgi:emp24/gp25L/p24 family/GOLD
MTPSLSIRPYASFFNLYDVNYARTPNNLSIVKPPTGKQQQIDVEVVDSSPRRNVYLSKRDITGETRLAVTAHTEGNVGVCFSNHLDPGEFAVHTRIEQ